MKHLIVMALAAMAIPVLAQDAPERPMRQRGANPQQQPALPEALMKKYDKDGDGKLSPEERTAMREEMQKGAKERRAELFKTMDKDGDGKVTLEEFLAAQPAAPMPPREGMPDRPKPPVNEQTKKFDKDGDGTFSDAERAAMRAELNKERGARRFSVMDKEKKGYITLEEFSAPPAIPEGIGPARPGAPGARRARGPRPDMPMMELPKPQPAAPQPPAAPAE